MSPGRPAKKRSGPAKAKAKAKARPRGAAGSTRAGPGKPKPKPKPKRAASSGRGDGAPSGGARRATDRPTDRDDHRPRPGGRGKSAPARGLGGEQVEGRQAVRELLLAGRRRVKEVLVTEHDEPFDTQGRPRQPARPHEGLQDIVDLALDLHVPVRAVSRARLLREARTEAPQGVLAYAAELPEVDLEELATPSKKHTPFLVAVDGVTDPGNLGTLIRSAECAGVTGFVLPRHRAVHITPAVTKASAGAVEYVPMTIVGGLPTAIGRLRDLGVLVIGLDAAGERPLFELPVDADVPVCLVLGSEGKGLSRLARQRCDVVAHLPLLGQLASLNVATAGTVACYEIARRRLG